MVEGGLRTPRDTPCSARGLRQAALTDATGCQRSTRDGYTQRLKARELVADVGGAVPLALTGVGWSLARRRTDLFSFR